jgi:hypothetical protein
MGHASKELLTKDPPWQSLLMLHMLTDQSLANPGQI